METQKGSTMRRYALASLLLLVLPGAALANGAMSLALSIFVWPIWLVYVGAMVFFEAFWIGRALKMPFQEAIKKSLQANLVTLILGAIFSGIFGYMLYGCFGTYFNPNPLAQSILLLTLGGLVSACIEAPFWKTWQGTPWRASLAAHLLGVPIALLILLLPPQPYTGLQGQAAWRRNKILDAPLLSALREELSEQESFPNVSTFPELLEKLRPRLHYQGYVDAPDLWAVAYRPDYHRFDTGERRRNPVEWNAALAGKRRKDLPELVWVIRWHESLGQPYVRGWIYQSRSGELSRSTDPTKLGF